MASAFSLRRTPHFEHRNLNIGCVFKVTDGTNNYLIMERDIEVLRALEDYRVLSLDQLWSVFFRQEDLVSLDHLLLMKGCPARGLLNATYHRLTKLAGLGYVERRHYPGFPHIYRLTWNGQKALNVLNRSRFSTVAAWPSEVRHPLMVAGVGLYFSRVLGIKVVTERELMGSVWSAIRRGQITQKIPIPDLKIFHGDSDLNIEIELSQKLETRYTALWHRLGNRVREERPAVLYLVPDEPFENQILLMMRRHYFPGIYVANLKRLCHDGYSVAWRNFNGERFHLAGNFGSAGV